jgi:3-hydroxyisobutyrate dehydrogenase-like beta-hydroxyacid dehydrogenase
MAARTIAVVATGDMGHAVGRALIEHGHRAVTCLAGRSARSRGLAEKAGIEELPSLEAVAREADIFLSILPPSNAVDLARDMAAAMTKAGKAPVYVDCNAISPETAAEVGAIVEAAGASFIDAGIIGLAPGKATPRFYVSGDDTAPMEALDGCGFEVIAMPGGGCQGSAIKMCYAGLTKGTWALYAVVLLAAERLGVRPMLMQEFRDSQSAEVKRMEARLPFVPADAGRWTGEMEEIAKCFRDAGVPGDFHEGAAEIYRILARTPYASETRETLDKSRTLEQSVPVFAAHIDEAAE